MKTVMFLTLDEGFNLLRKDKTSKYFLSQKNE